MMKRPQETRTQRKGRAHPLPVAVVIAHVDDKVLFVERAGWGAGWALPGGFIEIGETWQEASARELMEEASISVVAAEIVHVATLSAPDGTLLVFGHVPLDASCIAVPDGIEVTRVQMRSRVFNEVVFPLHREALQLFVALQEQAALPK